MRRNPRVQQAIIANAVMLLFFYITLFWQISNINTGSYLRVSQEGLPRVITSNMGMISTFIQSNIFFSAGVTCAIQMPLWIPVFKRESSNRLYSSTAYYFARVSSGMLFQFVFPLIITIPTFWTIGIKISLLNYVLFILNGMSIVAAGCGIGFVIGVTFDNPEYANLVINNIQNYCFLLAGTFLSYKNLDPFDFGISYLSPNRYAVEINTRLLSANLVDSNVITQQQVLDHYMMSIGFGGCFGSMWAITVGYVLLGWAIIVFRNSGKRA